MHQILMGGGSILMVQWMKIVDRNFNEMRKPFILRIPQISFEFRLGTFRILFVALDLPEMKKKKIIG